MKAQVNGIEINYIKEGEGKPLILLHGNGEDHSIFLVLIERLKKDFTIYALDSRNHGQSSKTDDFSYQAMAKDVYGFIENQELEDVSVLGFSDGAIIAVLLELEHRGLWKKMILLGINLQPSDFKEENLAYLQEEYAKTKDPLVKMMLEEPNIPLAGLKSITAPTLVVRAGDELFHGELYDKIVDTMPNATLLIMENHDHGSYIVNTDVLYEPLMKFLD